MEPRLSGGGKPSVSRFLGPVLVFSILAVSVSCHGPCKHRVPPPEEVVHHVHLKPERLTKRSSPDNLQLKIKIIYDYSVDQLPADKRRLVKDKLFPPAIDYLQRAFSVRRGNARFAVSLGSRGAPWGPGRPGVEGSDLGMYASRRDHGRCGQENISWPTLAHCQLEAEFLTASGFGGMLSSTVKHEIIHALVRTTSFF
ncbi:leishmanolysin-like peptidase [Perca flavescens]|uniref:leishmanolysin-like peptidase n=1 Tax=Perca flavescens TaxID=8167 RepID=UPI00106E2F69|nr:leishmanolysin-like peptidase [Perca flavescens]